MPTWYTVKEIEPPSGSGELESTIALDITNDGRVCGSVNGLFTVEKPFKYEASTLQTFSLDGPGFASGINQLGDVAGVFQQMDAPDDFARNRCFVWPHGAPSFTNLQTLIPEARDSWGGCVNDEGVVAGTYSTGPAYEPRAFLYESASGTLVRLHDLGFDALMAIGINNARQATGQASDGRGYVFNYASNTYTPISFPGRAINDSGYVIGNRDRATAMFYDGAGETVLPSFGGNYFEVKGINGLGQIVGAGSIPDDVPGSAVAFAMDPGGAPVNLNDYLVTDVPWHVFVAYGLNDAGQIIAYATRSDDGHNLRRGVLLTPTISPSWSLEVEAIVALIFGGVIFGGSGIGFWGGRFHRIPSNNPEDVRRTWSAMSPAQRDILLGVALTQMAKIASHSSTADSLTKFAAAVIGDSAKRLAAPAVGGAHRAPVVARATPQSMGKAGPSPWHLSRFGPRDGASTGKKE